MKTPNSRHPAFFDPNQLPPNLTSYGRANIFGSYTAPAGKAEGPTINRNFGFADNSLANRHQMDVKQAWDIARFSLKIQYAFVWVYILQMFVILALMWLVFCLATSE